MTTFFFKFFYEAIKDDFLIQIKATLVGQSYKYSEHYGICNIFPLH